ncbi:unnamed protein product [Prorocentrum cordatum]|uniref:GTP diphosphokinase n=1 Tax=Prorocentrum cordatum TaxID=2364126 RepID=A0ABN9QFU5_9DINO|nr:unnamed protein product [Polarella glacialis]
MPAVLQGEPPGLEVAAQASWSRERAVEGVQPAPGGEEEPVVRRGSAGTDLASDAGAETALRSPPQGADIAEDKENVEDPGENGGGSALLSMLKATPLWWRLASRGTPSSADDPDGRLMMMVEELWLGFEGEIMYLPRKDRLRVLQALCVAALAHKGQKRKSGEPYIVHPVAVAELLASLRLKAEVVMAGLLHDTVEDNQEMQFEDLEELFGQDVRKIVEGETKASKRTAVMRSDDAWSALYHPAWRFVFGARQQGTASSAEAAKAREQAYNLRDMFLAMADDWRVIIVKLADRLHNMRTLDFMPAEKRRGSTASLWRKLQRNPKYRNNLDNVSDIIALRVVLDVDRRPGESNEQFDLRGNKLCYHAVSLASRWDLGEEGSASRWNPDVTPRLAAARSLRIKDYIRLPKPNGYRSLHLLLTGAPVPLELQVRTRQMHNVAEYGAAAGSAALPPTQRMARCHIRVQRASDKVEKIKSQIAELEKKRDELQTQEDQTREEQDTKTVWADTAPEEGPGTVAAFTKSANEKVEAAKTKFVGNVEYQVVSDVVKAPGMQYIIAGGFKLTQDQIELSEFSAHIHGQLFAPTCAMGTCTASHAVIDMFTATGKARVYFNGGANETDKGPGRAARDDEFRGAPEIHGWTEFAEGIFIALLVRWGQSVAPGVRAVVGKWDLPRAGVSYLPGVPVRSPLRKDGHQAAGTVNQQGLPAACGQLVLNTRTAPARVARQLLPALRPWAVLPLVGMTMDYPEVNGARVEPSRMLQNGDCINIVTSLGSTPRLEWLKHAFLRSTRTEIIAHFRKLQESWRQTLIDVAAALATVVSGMAGAALALQALRGLPRVDCRSRGVIPRICGRTGRR